MADVRWKAYGVAAAVFLLDRLTKWMIETRMSVMDTYNVIPGFFDIIHSRNRGVAFSLFADSTSPWRTAILIAAALAAVVLVGVMLWRGSRLDRHQWIGEGSIGPDAFRSIMRDARLREVIKIIETPKGDDPVRHDRRMLRRLRAYARGPRDNIRMTATVGRA